MVTLHHILQAVGAAVSGCSPFTLVLCAVGLLVWVPWAINRWRFRHIPGPWSPPVLGNLLSLARHDLHGFLQQCSQRHGKLFKVYIGSSMVVCVSDPSLARRAFTRLAARHTGIQLTAGEQDWDFLQDGLVGANGAAWRSLRVAWQSAFSSSCLAGYVAGMNQAAEQLAEQLQAAAASGEQVDLFRELGAMTLDVVGQAAYGVDLHKLAAAAAAGSTQSSSSTHSSSSNNNNHQQQRQQQQDVDPDCLLSAIKAVFQGGGVANGSAYLPLVLLFPAAAPLVQWAAYHWPDAKLAQLAKARAKIRQLSLQLVRYWRGGSKQQQQQQRQEQNRAAAPPPSPQQAAADAPPPGLAHQHGSTLATAGGGGVANGINSDPAAAAAGAGLSSGPGTFPGLMLHARNKETGQQLSEEQVVAQLNTFLLAAFETTASAIAGCVYHIAQHPQVQQQLLQEVDAFGRDRSVAFSDLDQFPLVDAVVKETLRLLPPGAIAARITQQHYQLTQQVLLPPRTPLFACIHCYQRDPGYWPAAEEFRPERWMMQCDAAASLQPLTPDAYSPFGFGPRLCVGMRFANQEVVIALVRLYQRLTFTLQPGQVPLPLKQTFALIPAEGLKVTVHKRS